MYGRGTIQGVQEVLCEGSQVSHFLILIQGTFLVVWTPGTYGDPFKSLDPGASELLVKAMQSPHSSSTAATDASSSYVFHDATYQIDRGFDPKSLKEMGIVCDLGAGPPENEVIAEWCYRQCELADDDDVLDFYALDWREHSFPERLLERTGTGETYDADEDGGESPASEDEADRDY